ncbi:hypothetical protein [Tuanshanicoccus yangjingiae]
MERFNWTTDEIDRLDFNYTLDILMNELPDKKEEPLQFIDQVFGT